MMLKEVYWRGRCYNWHLQTLSISVFHLLRSRWAAVFLGKSHLQSDDFATKQGLQQRVISFPRLSVSCNLNVKWLCRVVSVLHLLGIAWKIISNIVISLF